MVRLAFYSFVIGALVGAMAMIFEIYHETQGISYSYQNQTHRFTLSGSFGRSTYPYRNLVNTLDRARNGDRVIITITSHTGGWNHTREYISNAILRSKAYVEIHVTRWAASNAALLYRYGNVAIIHKNARVLYHQSFNTDNWGRKSYPARLYTWSIREHNRVKAFVFMTVAERQRWERKQDIIISGHRICKSKFLLTDRGNYCIIKGIK